MQKSGKFTRQKKKLMRKVQKEILTDATEKNFFNLFFKSKSVTLIIGYFGQFVSGLTEFHFVFSAAQGIYKPFLVWSNCVPTILGLLAVYIFEFLGVRVYLVRIVRQIANKEFVSRESWILFGFNVLFVLALCGSNLWFSVLGQTASFHSMTNVRVTDKIFSIDSVKNANIGTLTAEYDTKKSQLLSNYEVERKATTKRYDNDIKELKNSRYTFKDITWKYNTYTAKIDKAINDKATDLKTLKTTLNSDLESLQSEGKERKSKLEKSFDTRINDIENNTNAQADLWAMVQRYTKPILIVFILLSWLSVIYTEVFFKGAGQSVEVKEVSFRPLLLWVLIVGLYDKFYHWFYNTVVGWIGLDKFRYGQIRTNEVEYKAEKALELANRNSTNSQPSIAAKVRQIGFNRNKKNATNGTSSNVQNLATNTTNITATIPTDYQLDMETINSNNGERINGERRELKTNERKCKNCGSVFTYKHWNARYCSDKCRIENWENRTGRKLKKGRRK